MKSIHLTAHCFLATLVLACSAQNVQNVKHVGKQLTYAEVSVGAWRSNLATERHDIGMLIWNHPKYTRVDTNFVNYAVEFAKLNGEILPSISVDVGQVEDGSSDGYLQPAEIVFDGRGMTSTGWNVLSLQFLRPTAWDYFRDRTSGLAIFRLDSAPTVSRIVFNPDQNRIGVEFSEVLQGSLAPSPITIEGPEGELDCTFNWGVPHDRANVACVGPLPSEMTIRVKELRSSDGSTVTAVDGTPFSLTVNPSDQPIQLDGLNAWTPSLSMK